MKASRVISVVLALLVLFGVAGVFSRAIEISKPSSISEIGPWTNQIVKGALQDVETLEQLAPSIMVMGGSKEHDGIFITKNHLLENIKVSDPDIYEKNLDGMEIFLKKHNIPAYFALIPTAVAIKQQEITASADLFNQKSFIADSYQRLIGQISSVDAYSALFSAADEYTYYRTASNLTGLGGYYVYSAIASRLGLSLRSLEQFEIEHLADDYYGDLYERSSYKGIDPDLLTLYRFTQNDRSYRLINTQNGIPSAYYELFPTHLATLGKPENVLFGGIGEIIDISVISPYRNSILIFGDETAISYLPFISVHYGHVTVVDLRHTTDEQLASIDPEDYDQVLFAYSVKNFIQNDFEIERIA